MTLRLEHPTSVRFRGKLRKLLRAEAMREERHLSDHLTYICKWWFANGGAKGLRHQADAAQTKFEEMKHGEE